MSQGQRLPDTFTAMASTSWWQWKGAAIATSFTSSTWEVFPTSPIKTGRWSSATFTMLSGWPKFSTAPGNRSRNRRLEIPFVSPGAPSTTRLKATTSVAGCTIPDSVGFYLATRTDFSMARTSTSMHRPIPTITTTPLAKAPWPISSQVSRKASSTNSRAGSSPGSRASMTSSPMLASTGKSSSNSRHSLATQSCAPNSGRRSKRP